MKREDGRNLDSEEPMIGNEKSIAVKILGLALVAGLMVSCAFMKTTGKVIATPVVAIRDTVDAPLVSLVNVFEVFASWSNPKQAPQPTIGWSYKGGFDFGIGYAVGFFFFKGLSYIVGGVDYVVCRSLYPQWAAGISPWKKKDQTWGDLYYPGTRALWGDHPADTWAEAKARKAAQSAAVPAQPGEAQPANSQPVP